MALTSCTSSAPFDRIADAGRGSLRRLLNLVRPIGLDVFQRGHHPRRPAQCDLIHLAFGADADQEAGVVGRLEAVTAFALTEDRPSADFDLDTGADGVVVAH